MTNVDYCDSIWTTYVPPNGTFTVLLYNNNYYEQHTIMIIILAMQNILNQLKTTNLSQEQCCEASFFTMNSDMDLYSKNLTTIFRYCADVGWLFFWR